MGNFLNRLIVWALLILSCALFYISVTIVFPSSFINIAAFVSAVFCLIQGCGIIDRIHHFGKYGDEKDEEEPKE